MPRNKFLITLGELQCAFNELPPSGYPQRTIKYPILLADESMGFLEFTWDYLSEKWQLNAENLLITISNRS